MSVLNRLASLASFAIIGLGPAVTSAAAQEIILYDQPNYQGESLSVDRYIRNLSRVGFNDRVGSIRVVSGTWRVCQHTDLEGMCLTIDADTASLGRLNNQLTSVRAISQSGGSGGSSGGSNNHPGGEALTLYSGPNYTGSSITLRREESDLGRRDFNDRARSIRYSGNSSWRLCQHQRFEGACMEVRADMPNIGGGMDREISSAQPDDTNRRGNRPRNGVFLYSAQDYRGQRVDLEYDTPDFGPLRFHDHASSLTIARGETWEFCEHANYRGHCETFTAERIDNLRDYGFDDMISSARRLDGSGGGFPPGGYPGGGRQDIDGGVRGVDALFFPRPEINGFGVDRCLRGNGNRCDQETADRICRDSGYSQAEHYDVDRYNRARTWFLGSNRECRRGQCAPIVNVLCTR